MGILIAFILLAAVSLTVIVSQQQQQIRQRASENPACEVINNISDCITFSASDSNVPCFAENGRCRIGNTIYECQK